MNTYGLLGVVRGLPTGLQHRTTGLPNYTARAAAALVKRGNPSCHSCCDDHFYFTNSLEIFTSPPLSPAPRRIVGKSRCASQAIKARAATAMDSFDA